MKAHTLGLCLLLAATPAAAGLSPNPIGVEISTGPLIFTNTELPVVIRTRTGFFPPFELGDITVVGREVQIDVLLPAETTIVDPYDAVLLTSFAPGTPGPWTVRVFARLGENRQEESAVSFTVHDDPVRLLYVGPPNPQAGDDIVVALDRQPREPLDIRRADGRVRILAGSAAGWSPAPDLHHISLGELPAGDWQIQLVTFGEGIHSQVDLTVAAAPEPPGPVVLAGDFTVAVTWENAGGETGEAKLVQPPSRDSALFYFFSPDNWELMVKVLDGCAINGHYWVFGAASTDVGYSIDITRNSTPQTFHADNEVGVAAPAITNITAFPCL